MLLADTASGFSAVVFVAGLVISVIGVVMFAMKKPSEEASKWVAGGLGVTALGVVLAQVF